MSKLTHGLVILTAVASLVLAGCHGGDDQAAGAASQTAAEAGAAGSQTAELADRAMLAGDEHVHGLRCGCAVEGVGQCGNYVEVEGEFVELVLPEEIDEELGTMPFCGKTDLMARVEGELVDGKFVATTFEYVEP